jgi:hypothetical protein
MPGDIVVVTKLDRLGRSTRELLELIERAVCVATAELLRLGMAPSASLDGSYSRRTR